jgi:hypothetical protein
MAAFAPGCVSNVDGSQAEFPRKAIALPPRDLGAAVVLLLAYWAYSEVSRHFELLTHRQEVITATVASIEKTASALSGSVVIPDGLVARLSNAKIKRRRPATLPPTRSALTGQEIGG